MGLSWALEGRMGRARRAGVLHSGPEKGRAAEGVFNSFSKVSFLFLKTLKQIEQHVNIC